MEPAKSRLTVRSMGILFAALLTTQAAFSEPAQAITESVGQPYHGRLINGIPFPSQFPGYQLREESRIHATPEVIGALLDAIDSVQNQYPSSCDLYLGDFSRPGGGPMTRHRSHQNGRDVDVGMYARDNRRLDTFIPMNEENLDVPKTWCLIEGILRSQRVQYIFLDRRIQALLHEYALSQGADAVYLDRLFGNARGGVIRHLRNHQDHIHVRFYAPWSTLAAQIGEGDEQKLAAIEMAQQAYLPKKVNYYVKGNERSLDALAQSFGVSRRDLCRWNQIQGNSLLSPGSCLVFYKRGFEMEPVHLAQSLQPASVAESKLVQMASLRSGRTLTDAPAPSRPTAVERWQEPSIPTHQTYTIRRGDTLRSIARRNGMELKELCQLNGIRRATAVKPGQTIKVASLGPFSALQEVSVSDMPKGGSAIQNKSTKAFTTHTTAKGDTLAKIARRYDMDVESLCKINGIKKGATLKPGRSLKVTPQEEEPPVKGPSRVTNRVTKTERLERKNKEKQSSVSSPKGKKASSAERSSVSAAGTKTSASVKKSPEVRKTSMAVSKIDKSGKASNRMAKHTRSRGSVN